jgi:hypothetical protein
LTCCILVVVAFPGGAGAKCLTCPKPQPRPALKFRFAGGIADRHASWPRAGAVSGGAAFTAERSHGLIDSQNLRLSLRPQNWHALSPDAGGSLATASASMRHMIVTDHMAESWFLMPWIDVGLGVAREAPGDSGPFTRAAHTEDLARFAVGLDVWPVRHYGFFAAWDATTHSARPFETPHYHTDHGLEVGLIFVTQDGGYSR